MRPSDIATTASYTAASSGVVVGSWLSENWLQLLSAVVVLATFVTQWVFALRQDRRDRARSKPDEQK